MKQKKIELVAQPVNSKRSLNFTEESVTGSYWNRIKCKCRMGGSFLKRIPFSASWKHDKHFDEF